MSMWNLVPNESLYKSLRSATRTLISPKLLAYVTKRLTPSVPDSHRYRCELAQRCTLEIGGPSQFFGDDGPLPLYQALGSVDNCLYSTTTIWTDDVREGQTFKYHAHKPDGRQFVCEASDLKAIENSSYECVLACHCLEHLSNPLLALREWKRVLKDDGFLLLVLPHKDGTFDYRRTTTTLAHMISDFENNVAESDLTHLPEILALHDLERDKEAGTKEQFRERCLKNYTTRAMHHHVFETKSAVALIDVAGFQVIRVQTVRPFHIVILGMKTRGRLDNGEFLTANPEYCRRSPFPSDHKH